jgi:hypothetical protein
MRPGLERQPWGEITVTIADPFYNHLNFQRTHADIPAA